MNLQLAILTFPTFFAVALMAIELYVNSRPVKRTEQPNKGKVYPNAFAKAHELTRLRMEYNAYDSEKHSNYTSVFKESLKIVYAIEKGTK